MGFLFSASGRLFRTKVAFVCVGAGLINKSATRCVLHWGARLALYRSYRDTGSREAMRRHGLDAGDPGVSRSGIFPTPSYRLSPWRG